jgi:23S rRNA (cytosine1962-C5)-methyltransferase
MIVLKAGRAEALAARRHPWVYSGAVERVEGEDPGAGLVPVADPEGRILAWGFYSPSSLIAVRLAAWGEVAPPEDWLERRLAQAAELRRGLSLDSDAFRLVNAEGDFLPGLVVDVYRGTTVVRPLVRGLEAVMERVTAALTGLFPGNAIFLKRDEKAARLERLALATGYLRGGGDGRQRIREGGLELEVDLERGQKTGFYLDQRESRLLVRRLAAGRRVLNLFAYTGAFALQAVAGGALEAVSVESSRAALELGRVCAGLNPELPAERLAWIEGDAFRYLTDGAGGGLFDLTVVDPPPFARRRSDLPGALKAYTELNRLALSRTAPGGLLLCFSCSSAVSSQQFSDALRAASRQAGRAVQLLRPLAASADHPVALDHPEGEYLKGWLLRAL